MQKTYPWTKTIIILVSIILFGYTCVAINKLDAGMFLLNFYILFWLEKLDLQLIRELL